MHIDSKIRTLTIIVLLNTYVITISDNISTYFVFLFSLYVRKTALCESAFDRGMQVSHYNTMFSMHFLVFFLTLMLREDHQCQFQHKNKYFNIFQTQPYLIQNDVNFWTKYELIQLKFHKHANEIPFTLYGTNMTVDILVKYFIIYLLHTV